MEETMLRGLWRSTIPMTSEPQLGRRPGGKGLATDTGGFGGAPLASLATRLVIGSWNVSGWTASKLRTVLADIQADILALQETHLAAMPLQWAHGTVETLDGIYYMGILSRQCRGVPLGARVGSVSCYGPVWLQRLHYPSGRLGAGYILRAVSMASAWRHGRGCLGAY